MAEVRLIDANLIVKFIQDGLNNPDKEKAFGHDAIEILAEIECNTPTISPDSLRPKGQWIDRPSVKGQVYCSECAMIEKVTDSNYKSRSCPNCGAKMEG